MPHSYGADFSGVGFFGPRTLERRTEISAKPAPSAIMMRMESQPCMVNVWACERFPKPVPDANTTAEYGLPPRGYDPAHAHRLVLAPAAHPVRHRGLQRGSCPAAGAGARDRLFFGDERARLRLEGAPRSVRPRRVSAR